MMRWLRLWRRKQMGIRRALKNTHLHHVLGERIFHSHLWAIDRRSLAGGLSLGLFVAFTPTIPFQMFLCTVGALLFRVNLPLALAACWITNPVTAVPVYLAGRNLGKRLFEETPLLLFSLDLFNLEGRGRRFLEESTYLWTGCLIFGSAASLAGNLAVRLLALVFTRWRRRPPRKDSVR